MPIKRSIEMEVAGGTGYQARMGQSRQCVRDRRPFCPDELAEQAVGERQRHPDACRLNPSPARRQMPEKKDETYFEARLARDRAQSIDVRCASDDAAQEGLHDLRPGPYPIGKLGVQQRELGWTERSPAIAPLQQIVCPAVRKLK